MSMAHPVPNPRFQNRPRVTINTPYNSQYPQSPYIPTAATTIPNGTGQPNYPAGTEENPFAYAGDFMFKQFEGFRDFTKSGLNVGEKSAYWIYNKFSTWSKKWFTHIFLFLVVLCYSLAGASMFVAIEGRSKNFFLLKFLSVLKIVSSQFRLLKKLLCRYVNIC